MIVLNANRRPPPPTTSTRHLGLRGAYLRDLISGAIVECTPWDVRFAKLAAVAATARGIAVEMSGGVDVRDRATGAVERVPGDALDARLAIPDGSRWRVRARPRSLPWSGSTPGPSGALMFFVS